MEEIRDPKQGKGGPLDSMSALSYQNRYTPLFSAKEVGGGRLKLKDKRDVHREGGTDAVLSLKELRRRKKRPHS